MPTANQSATGLAHLLIRTFVGKHIWSLVIMRTVRVALSRTTPQKREGSSMKKHSESEFDAEASVGSVEAFAAHVQGRQKLTLKLGERASAADWGRVAAAGPHPQKAAHPPAGLRTVRNLRQASRFGYSASQSAPDWLGFRQQAGSWGGRAGPNLWICIGLPDTIG